MASSLSFRGWKLLGKMRSDIIIKSDSFKGFLYSLGGSILVSTNFVTAKYGLKGFNPETFSLVWTVAATTYAFIIVLATGHGRELLLSPSRGAIKIIWMGLATGAGMILGWQGLARLDPSFASFLWRFQPVLTITFGVLLLSERLMMKELFPITIMVIGGCLSTIGRWSVVGTGTVLTILACGAATVQMLIAKTQSTERHPNILVFYRVAIGAMFIALWTFLSGKAVFDVKRSYWLITLLGAFLGPCTSFLLTFRSYRYWELSRASIVKTAEPLFVLLMVYIIFERIPTGRALLGGLLILVGGFWLSWIHFGGGKKRKTGGKVKRGLGLKQFLLS